MTGTRPTPRDRRRATRVAALVLACCLALVATAAFVPVPAGAGDNVAIFSFEPEDADATAGETLELELVVSSHGDYVGDGIDELSATIAYDSDVFTVADVEHERMLADGDPDVDVRGSDEVDDEAGTLTISQERDPSGDGATTTQPAATIAFEVADDAPTSNETIELADASAVLVSDYPQGTIERDAEIRIDGTAAASNSSDGVPGFTAPVVLVAALGALLVASAVGRRAGR